MAVMRTQILAGRYVLGAVLGVGGMATVWRATDEVLGREVAVKVLSPHYAADGAFVARFEREARHAAQLSHPRLVTVFDSGLDNGTAFIVMELVAGRTLRQVLDDQGFLVISDAVRIAIAVCEALEVAHAAGLVHRDIKPANIAISGNDIKVLDFGIARADGAGVTRTQGVLGTAAYLSPEQASAGVADARSDLYSLGCVLFEMLTGTAPFTADSAVGLAYMHVHDDPGAPSERRPGVPPQVDRITAHLLAKDPAARPPTAAAARAGLRAALRDDATAVLARSVDGQFRQGDYRAERRFPTKLVTALAAALTAALVALVAMLVSGENDHAAPPTHPAITSHPPRTTGPKTRNSSQHATALPPAAAAAATFVGELDAGVADGQVTQQAAQDLFNHLQQLLFSAPGQKIQELQKQYGQLVQAYEQHRSQGEVTGQAAKILRRALNALGAAVGA